ncbi:Cytochrome c, class I [Vibrio mediterranei AK1]|uniref:c-type cytochrome n=1 Tax=Vibrio TaxID=662 RepID=UPI0001542E11|nr:MULTISPECIES: c-type cytochrome [Vibrio]EDL51284.1 Cytochrome c, class I [Vibrio mediterranei AK1]MCF4176027.1 c-type cytochrome [Vibrio sp. McD22-P3]MDA0111268.1 c-type cytochrome [Vibrio sp. La 4.2.2]USE00550.1 c-type cytochrome [Vibrio sp. SCSIO 43133]
MNIKRIIVGLAAISLTHTALANNIMEACIDCHGSDGVGRENTIPNLRGQPKAYLEAQVLAFKSGHRTSSFMEPIVHDVADDQLVLAADFYASIPVDTPETLQWRGDKWPADMPLGERIAYSGKWNSNVPACVSCHGPNGVGVAPSFPMLIGQNKDYLINQLNAWKNDQRPPGLLGTMVTISKALSEEEIEAVAEYFSSQGGSL